MRSAGEAAGALGGHAERREGVALAEVEGLVAATPDRNCADRAPRFAS